MAPSEVVPLVAAKPPPPLNIPSGSTVSVKIINSTSTIKLPLSMLMGPNIPGHDDLECPSYSFLIEHSSGRKLLFDLGTRKDQENFSPTVRNMIKSPGWKITVDKDVADILEENKFDTGSIEGVIWSHWHCRSYLIPESWGDP